MRPLWAFRFCKEELKRVKPSSWNHHHKDPGKLNRVGCPLCAIRSSSPSGQPKKRAASDRRRQRQRAQLLAEFLQMSGYETEIVSDGCQALQYLKEHEYPEVLLLDMQMPA